VKRSGPPVRKTPLKQGGPLPRRTRLRSKPQHRRDDPAYLAAKEEVARRDQGQCVACRLARLLPSELVTWPRDCRGSLDPHHLWPTEWHGPLADPGNIVTIHRSTHDWIKVQPRDAARVGLLAQSEAGLAWAQEFLRSYGLLAKVA
jgi:hypothetical protein